MFQYQFLGTSCIIKRIRKAVGLKPCLPYLELHLADHCNLNCKGCSHFAPIAEKRFASLHDYERDLKQLQKLFCTITKIRLMGGEPLLNPLIDDFIVVTKTVFPKAELRICTNGLLLQEMPEKFWNVCRNFSVGIDITIYPITKKEESAFKQLVKNNRLKAIVAFVPSFHAFYNSRGNTDAKTAFKRCRKHEYTPMLKDGRIYICPKPATLFNFNRKFDLNVPMTGFVDIHAPNLDGWTVLSRLNESSAVCSYCTLGWKSIPMFPWSTSNLLLEDWEASTKPN